MFLTPDELAELTGRQKYFCQVRFLQENQNSNMSGFDEGRVFWSDQNQGSDQNGSIPRKVMERQLADFIRTFYRDGTFTYREMLVSNTNMGEFKLEVRDLLFLVLSVHI